MPGSTPKKYVSSTGLVGRSKQSKHSSTSLDAEVVKDPERLAGLLNRAMDRIEQLEGSSPPSYIEFDVTCPSSGTIRINHGFSGAVRWYVTSWRRKGVAGLYNLTELLPNDQPKSLLLTSKIAGQAVIRVESVQSGQEARNTASNDAVAVIDAPGSPGDVIVNAAGVLAGVSPSTSGNILTSNGSAWTSVVPAAPGNNHDVIVKASGVLTGVAPGAANRVLTSNGTDWVSAIVPTSPLGWQTAYDIDFTSLGLTTASADGNFTIDGKTWTVVNFAKSSVMSVGGANGLRVKATNLTSTLTPGSRTAPMFQSPSMATLLSGIVTDDARLGLRMSWYVISNSRTNTNDSTFGIFDTGSNNQRTEYSQFNNGSFQKDFMRLVLNNATKTSATLDTLTSGRDCFQIEMIGIGIDFNFLNQGVYSAGWPTKWFRNGQNSSAAGTWGPILMTQQSECFCCLGLEAGTTAANCEAKFGRFKLEYYRYE